MIIVIDVRQAASDGIGDVPCQTCWNVLAGCSIALIALPAPVHKVLGLWKSHRRTTSDRFLQYCYNAKRGLIAASLSLASGIDQPVISEVFSALHVHAASEGF